MAKKKTKKRTKTRTVYIDKSADIGKVQTELRELEKKKQEYKKKIMEAKEGKTFFQKTGVSFGAAPKMAAINKAIGERKEFLRAKSQIRNLSAQRDLARVQGEVSEAREKAQEARKKTQRRISDDIFDTDKIFKL